MTSQTTETTRWREGELLIRFKEATSPEQIDSLLQANGAERAGRLRGQSGVERLRLSQGSDPESIATILRTDSSVAFAEPNYLITADEVTPNDPRYPEQWALRNTGTSGGQFGADINAAKAWEMASGSRSTVIAVIDSGIDLTHPELRGNSWSNIKELGDSTDDDGNGFTDDLQGWDFVTNTGEITDGQGHGTGVAGIIAARGYNGIGITGVMWRASLMSLRVLDSTGTGDVARAVEAIDYAVEHGAKVINCSWGTDDNSVALSQAIKRAGNSGVPVVASSGNGSRDTDVAPRYPASYDLPNLISVASTDNSDLLTSWSNWGATRVTIAAPGKDILTTKMGGGYQTVSGSSSSAPFVAGVAGLVKSVRPYLSAERTRELIVSGVRQMPSLSGKVSSGGVVNAAATIAAVDTLPFDEGLRRSDGGEPDGDGTIAGQEATPGQGPASNTERHDGDGGNYNVTPPARTQGVLGSGLPNLGEVRRKQPVVPKAPAPIPSTRCSHKDPDCTSKKDQTATGSPVVMIAWGMSLTPVESLSREISEPVSDSPFRLFGSSSSSMAVLAPLPQTTRANVALASNGATATASSSWSGYAPSGVINGDRKGLGAGQDGCWSTATSGFPAELKIEFNGSKTIDEIDVFKIQDNYLNPSEPTETMTFTLYGLTSYEVQYWNGSAWANVTGGSISNNIKVWRKFTFSPVTTTKIRVLTNATPDGYSRLAEVEAWGTDALPRTNVALASNGGAASASSQFSGSYPATVANNGERRGIPGGGTGGFWNDATTVFPDWLQIDFNGTKTIDEIDVFTVQDNYSNPAEPTETMSFTLYGLTGYEVQYLSGTSWVTVPNGSVTSNTKVWRKFTFSPVTTTKIRVLTNASADGYSRITEVEAWGTAAGSTDPSGDNYSTTRIDPYNRTGQSGVDLLSGNVNWSLPIFSLKGRAGLDLGLALSYNSLVWTKSPDGTSIKFDPDFGTPSPGFRLGFPVIQPRYYNSQVGKHAYLLITPSGSRVELRQVETSTIYESADSSYLQLIDDGNGSLTLRPTDGSQLSYSLRNGQYHCDKMQDRNGNFISVSYHSDGRINTITDTLARVITFNYDIYQNLTSITQPRGATTHTWATFGWSNLTITTSFNSNLTVVGPQNNAVIPVLTSVGLGDGTYHKFRYNSWGQVDKVTSYAADSVQNGQMLDTHPLNYISYTLPTGAEQADCPRVSESRVWAENWNNLNGVPAEIVTGYNSAAASGGSSGQMTMPDNTVYKETFATSGWEKGLTTRTDTIVGGVSKKWTTLSWTQDDVSSIQYRKNPRVIETNVYDPANRKRTTIDYGSYASYGLPYSVSEYEPNGTTVLRTTYTDYNLSQAYLDRRIIGLVSSVEVKVGSALQSKVTYSYDAGGLQLVATTPNATQHDAGYGVNINTGRGLLTSVSRHDVTGASSATVTQIGYDTNGSVVFTKDALNHQTKISYEDSFSDTVNRNTFAYPTKVTPPLATGEIAETLSSTSQYDYHIGAVTRTQGPVPAGHTQGAIQTMEYDAAGRITRVNNLVNNAYKRWVYGSDGAIGTYTTVQTGSPEAYSVAYMDGVGRVRATGADHPNSAGAYRGQFTYYDIMGRASQTSNPGEMNDHWIPTGEDAAGWIWTLQAYDWKGRPTLTTNPDGTTKEATYGGCGCAGGESVTIRDEVGRKQRVTSDVLGRAYKTEVLNKDDNYSIYSTVTNTYNARDQITNVVEQAASGGATQTTILTYDGHGRLKTQQRPGQTVTTNYTYYADDTVHQVTDGRGIVTTFAYNDRHQTAGIDYGQASGIADTGDVTLVYDAVGNRTSMTDGSGSVSYAYDRLSRLTSETRQFNNLAGTHPLTYTYNLANQLTSITDPKGAVINYAYDMTGRTTGVTGSSFAGVTQYASNIQYRAWGAVKYLNSGDGKTTEVYYNNLKQPTNFSVGTSNSSLISKQYEYNSDGRLRYSQDHLDNRFDRSYSYDHMGRVTEAFSGPKARGLTDTNDRPYNLTYSYDALNRLTYRGGKQWSRFGGFANTGSGIYDNNGKNTGWEYDVDGRLTNDIDTQYTYDAAGRALTVISDGGDLTQTQIFDGDGGRTKMVIQQILQNELDESTYTETTIRYFVTSSVLDQVVTELDQSGEKRRTFVYGDDQVLAWQQKSGSTEALAWEHRDLSEASVRIPGASESSDTGEFEPLGSDAGTSNPFIYPPQRPSGEDLTYPGFAELMSGKCQIRGIPAPCDMVYNMRDHGVAREVIPGQTDSNGNPLPDAPNTQRVRLKKSKLAWDEKKKKPSQPGAPGRYYESSLINNEDVFIGNHALLLPHISSEPLGSVNNPQNTGCTIKVRGGPPGAKLSPDNPLKYPGTNKQTLGLNTTLNRGAYIGYQVEEIATVSDDISTWEFTRRFSTGGYTIYSSGKRMTGERQSGKEFGNFNSQPSGEHTFYGLDAPGFQSSVVSDLNRGGATHYRAIWNMTSMLSKGNQRCVTKWSITINWANGRFTGTFRPHHVPLP